MPVHPLIGSIPGAHGEERPSPLMVAIGAICRPGSVHLCCECMTRRAPFGSATCEEPSCVASLAAWLAGEEAKPECQHEDDGGMFFAKCRKCGATLDDYAGGD